MRDDLDLQRVDLADRAARAGAADGGHVQSDDTPIDNDDEANDHSLTVLSASGENSLEGKWSDPDIDDAGGGIVALLRCQRCAGQVAMLCRTPGAF